MTGYASNAGAETVVDSDGIARNPSPLGERFRRRFCVTTTVACARGVTTSKTVGACVPARFCYRGGAGERSSAPPTFFSPRRGLTCLWVRQRRCGPGGHVPSAADFVVTTVVMDTMPDTVLIGGTCFVALALGRSTTEPMAWSPLAQSDRGPRSLVGRWGVPRLLGGSAARALAAGDRRAVRRRLAVPDDDGVRSRRPPWQHFLPADRPGPTALSGAVAAAVGSAGLLASWESPSSFSPFAKFPLA